MKKLIFTLFTSVLLVGCKPAPKHTDEQYSQLENVINECSKMNNKLQEKQASIRCEGFLDFTAGVFSQACKKDFLFIKNEMKTILDWSCDDIKTVRDQEALENLCLPYLAAYTCDDLLNQKPVIDACKEQFQN